MKKEKIVVKKKKERKKLGQNNKRKLKSLLSILSNCDKNFIIAKIPENISVGHDTEEFGLITQN